jgi:hypothetical protein
MSASSLSSSSTTRSFVSIKLARVRSPEEHRIPERSLPIASADHPYF